MKTRPAVRASRPWSPGRTSLVALAVALFAWLLYVPSLHNAFVWDDIILIGNPEIRTLNASVTKRLFTTNFWDVSDATSGMYRPLTTLSYYVDYQLYGDNPVGFHQTNMILNAATCAAVFLVLLEMFAQPLLALIAAAWFAAFPMHVESVAWVSGRTDIVATLFALLALWFYVRSRRYGRVGAGLAALLCYALALLGKEVAVVLPGIAATYELIAPVDAGPPARAPRRWAVFLGMCVLTVVYLVVRHSLLGSSLGALPRFTHGLSQAVALTFAIVAHHTYKLIYPFRLNPTSDFPPPVHFFNLDTMVGIAVVILAVASVIRWRQHRAFVFGLAVIAFGLAPVLHIVPANAVMAEHFLYLPSFGYALLVSLAVMYLAERRRTVALTAFGIALLACCVRTVTGTRVWKDDFILFKKAVAMAPSNPTAHFDLGVSLGQRGRLEEAQAELEHATQLDPNYADAWSALGRTENELGRHVEGLEHCTRAVQLAPDDARFVNDLGMMQFQTGHFADAAHSFRRVLELRPRHAYARFNLGLALYQQSDFEGAIEQFDALPNKDRDFPKAWFFLAECQMRTGNTTDAAASATHFLSLNPPDDAMAAQARKIAAGTAQ
ncbi:MAG TPA: tetratricopeptide repeat protein [Candidatus Krumholzibacteria bacterium]|nr:tetratricopeptide repeat protein [Candidatus Krumholzibacteria bacterium]